MTQLFLFSFQQIRSRSLATVHVPPRSRIQPVMRYQHGSKDKPVPRCHGATLALLILGATICCALNSKAATYVISTDGQPLSAGLLQAIGAAQGLATPGFVFLAPASPGSINGTPLGFGGINNNIAYFGVAGDLHLANGDQILGVGANFLHLEVGRDATIDAGAKISVEGHGPYAGAGGGAGGAAGAFPFSIDPGQLSAGGIGGNPNSRCTSGNGASGTAGHAAVLIDGGTVTNGYIVRNWAYPSPGGPGGTPVRGFTSPGNAGTDVHFILYNATGGNGGSGGAAGVSASFTVSSTPGWSGSDGQAGQMGLAGADGTPGGLPVGPPQFWIDAGGLYGGAGGGGGEQGGYGLAGGGGGVGGAGGQGGYDLVLNPGGLGGNGGEGGNGGTGGPSGIGGAGGGGGGGLEIIVRGTLNLSGTISARGADGGVGVPGTPGNLGVQGQDGGAGSTTITPAPDGGPGGAGGAGGSGGKGGNGGGGGGGAGGTVSLAANKITGTGTFDVGGGAGVLGTAPNGILRSRSDLDGTYNNQFAPTTSRHNPYISYPFGLTATGVPLDDTPVINGALYFKLQGGPDIFGYYSVDGGSTPDTSFGYRYQTNLAVRPLNAVGLISRENFTAADTPNPQLFFANCSTAQLSSPAVAVNRAGDFSTISPQPLVVRGYAREPMFVSRSTDGDTLSALPSLYTWMTYLRSGDSTVTAVFAPYTNPATFTFATSGSGNSLQNFWLLDTGLLRVDAPSGLIPVYAISDRQTNTLTFATQVRAGAVTRVNFDVSNVGNPNSLMSSISGSDVIFTNLAPNGPSATLAVAVSASAAFGLQPPATAQVVSDAGQINVTVNPTAIGPVLATTLTGNGNAGPLLQGNTATLTFTAQNTAGPFASDTLSSLYSLNISNMWIEGPDASSFALLGPLQGGVPLKFNLLGNTNLFWTNQIVFTPTAIRKYSATLRVATDRNAVAGGQGDILSFPLAGAGANPGIFIARDPRDTRALPGSTATFTVAAQLVSAPGPLTYQWKRNGTAIAGATNSSYTTGSTSLGDNGATFSCLLTAGAYSTESALAYLTVFDTTSAYSQAVLADNPLVYYRFEETGGTVAFDATTNGFNGTYSNVTHVPGPTAGLGQSAGFNGWNTQGNVAMPALFQPGTSNCYYSAVTVEAWVKLDSWNNSGVASDSGLSGIVCGDQWPWGSFQMTASVNQFNFGVHGSAFVVSGVDVYSDDYSVQDASFNTNVWFHLATVYADGGLIAFVVNGVPVSVLPLNQPQYADLTSAHIGAWLGFDGNLYRFFNGQIDEVAVYGTALGFDRLAAHYQAALATIAPPTLNYSLQPGGLSLQWNGIGFVLQHNPDPSNPSGWSDVPSGNLSPVLVNPSLGQDFFRLRKP